MTLGRYHPDGFYGFYVVHAIAKTPIGLQAIVLVGLLAALARGARRDHWLVLALALVLFLGPSLLARAQLSHRQVLACVPLVYALAAAGLGRWSGPGARRILVLGGCLVAALEQLPYLGNPLSFTSAWVHDETRAHEIVSAYDLDMGQNDERVREWNARQPAPLPLDPPHPLPGRNLVGLRVYARAERESRFEPSRCAPLTALYHSHLICELDEAGFEELLDEGRSLRAEPVRCAGRSRPLEGVIEIDRNVCIETDAGADIVLRASSARGAASARPWRGELGGGPTEAPPRVLLWDGERPRFEVLLPGHRSWLRLGPGAHRIATVWTGGRPVSLSVVRGTVRVGVREPTAQSSSGEQSQLKVP